MNNQLIKGTEHGTALASDPHVPLVRSEDLKRILGKLNTDVTIKVHQGMAYTINKDEVRWVNQNILL